MTFGGISCRKRNPISRRSGTSVTSVTFYSLNFFKTSIVLSEKLKLAKEVSKDREAKEPKSFPQLHNHCLLSVKTEKGDDASSQRSFNS